MPYHHLGDLYTADHGIKGERALKERVPARKGIPGLRAWLTRRSTVLAPLLRVPPPRWQAAPKDWTTVECSARVPCRSGDWRPGGQDHSGKDRVPQGHAIKVTTSMKDTMEAKDWAPELRVCCQPPNTLPSDTRLCRLLVALVGVSVQVNGALHAQL